MARRSIKVKIEPAILKYARYCSGYKTPEAAKKIGLAEDNLTSLESTEVEISIAQLEKISSVYKMPLAYFFLKKKPDDAVIPEGFRIVYASKNDEFSPRVMLAVRRARYVQSVIQELSVEKIEYKFKRISLKSDVDEVAAYFRSVLNISVEDQSKWIAPAASLKHW